MPEKISSYVTRNVDGITLIKIKHNFFKNTFFLSAIIKELTFNFKGDFTLDGMKAECRGDIAFFCSCTCVKVLFTHAFLKCRFR